MESQKAQSTAENSTAVDLTNNPAAATIASDTGEVPSNVTTKLGTYQKRQFAIEIYLSELLTLLLVVTRFLRFS